MSRKFAYGCIAHAVAVYVDILVVTAIVATGLATTVIKVVTAAVMIKAETRGTVLEGEVRFEELLKLLPLQARIE